MMAASNADGYNSADAVQLGSGNEVVWGAVGGSDGKEGETCTSMNGAAEFKVVVDMGSEAVRLASYKSWPHSAPVNPSALARAGLFYTGKDDVVQCFSCEGQMKDWEYGDTAMGEHKSLFPNCAFVKGTDSRNDPLIKDMSRFAQLNVSSSQKENEDDDKGKGGAKENSGGKKGKKKKGKKKKGKKKQNDDDDDDDDDSSIFNVEDDPQFIEANRVLKSEYKRLLTFIYWPKNAPVLPEDLAKAGFYYCGSDDRVQCFCCYGILKNWRPGDSAMNEHRKYFPSCPFVRGEDVGNEPMRLVTRQGNVDDTPVKQTSRDPNRVENFQNQQQNQPPRNVYGASNTAAPQRSQTQSQHRHPEYADEDKRMATSTIGHLLILYHHKNYAELDFTTLESKTTSSVFIVMVDLEIGNQQMKPWTEHARWFPKCEYILTERGSAFVNYVTSRYPRVPSSNPQASGRGQEEKMSRNRSHSDAQSDDEEEKIKKMKNLVMALQQTHLDPTVKCLCQHQLGNGTTSRPWSNIGSLRPWSS
ncbi:E3 ubiquitin-protein ligase XIAP-like [Ptychodera flava]|uniref:E3 ubiquitin-protein ligase XIAP-like n=1 Tax=Ptychodera flava TaxID=63121 RepID=UPI00396A7287